MYSFHEEFQFLSNICGLVIPAVYGLVLDTFFRASYQLKRDADKTEKSTVKTVKGTEWHTKQKLNRLHFLAQRRQGWFLTSVLGYLLESYRLAIARFFMWVHNERTGGNNCSCSNGNLYCL